MNRIHGLGNKRSTFASTLAIAAMAGCGTAVTVQPGFSPEAAGHIDRMLLVIDNQGGLRGLIGGARPLEAISAAAGRGLSASGYPISTPADLGLGEPDIEALSAGRTPEPAPDRYSHVLEVTLEPVQHGKAPTGFSLSVGDSDPRGGPSTRRGSVLPVSCALLDGRSLREEAIARSERAVPRAEEGWRSKGSGPDQRVAALAAEIWATCEPLLAELKVARAGGAPAAATTYGSGIRIEVVPAEEAAKEKGAKEAAAAAAPASRTPGRQPAQLVPLPESAAPAPAAPVTEGAQAQAVAPAAPAAASPPAAPEAPSVSTERTTTRTGRKQIRVYNPGGTVILEFGHERR